MLCQSCQKKQATFHYRANDNGNITETHLCADCAKKSGLIEDSYKIFNPFGFEDSFFENSNSMLGEILGGMLGEPNKKTITESLVCPFCGMRLSEFLRNGKAGCSQCYSTFSSYLEPTLKKLHGNTKHTGKIPAGREIHKSKEQQISELENMLKSAVEAQEYEKAAEYRDKIRELGKEDA